jgi:peptidoglycan hydrolase CwlO-like protein
VGRNDPNIVHIYEYNNKKKSLANIVQQVENTVLGTEDKVEELDQKVKGHDKMLRKYEWKIKDIQDTIKKPNL